VRKEGSPGLIIGKREGKGGIISPVSRGKERFSSQGGAGKVFIPGEIPLSMEP